MARTYMSGHYASGSCGEFSAGGRRGVGDTHTRGWNAGVEVDARTPKDERDRFDVYMTPGSSGSGRRVFLGTVHDTPDGPVFVPAFEANDNAPEYIGAPDQLGRLAPEGEEA